MLSEESRRILESFAKNTGAFRANKSQAADLARAINEALARPTVVPAWVCDQCRRIAHLHGLALELDVD